MMSLEMNIERKFAEDFLAAQDKLNKIGFEIIGTKDINNKIYFMVKEYSSRSRK